MIDVSKLTLVELDKGIEKNGEALAEVRDRLANIDWIKADPVTREEIRRAERTKEANLANEYGAYIAERGKRLSKGTVR